MESNELHWGSKLTTDKPHYLKINGLKVIYNIFSCEWLIDLCLTKIPRAT